MNRNQFASVLLLFFVTLMGVCCFDPFMDSNLFAINWLGPLDLNQDEILSLGERHLVVTTDEKETYRCILPEVKDKSSDDGTKYNGPGVDEIMQPLFLQQQCSYRIESYWTYELCHGKSLRQYHETREQGTKPKVQEYFLGLGNSRLTSMTKTSATVKGQSDTFEGVDKSAEDTPVEEEEVPGEKDSPSAEAPLPVREIEGVQLPYYEVVMDGGTPCDLTGQPRKSRVMYICQPQGRGEIYELEESSTCEYDVIVLSGVLCQHPSYRPKTQPVSEIKCHAMTGSPLKPSELIAVEREVRHLQTAPLRYTPEENVDQADEEIEIEKDVEKTKEEDDAPVAKIKPQEDPQSVLSSITDKQTLQNILSGSQCLRGGTGWWKHEVCIGKYAKQFHKDKQVDAHIYLGYWDKQNHLQWLEENPSKRPRPAVDRKYVSLYYSNGDVCDLTGKPRSCEVRLKCLQNIKNKHAVIISLAEPSSCQYILTVESYLFCEAVKHADNNGLFENIDL